MANFLHLHSYYVQCGNILHLPLMVALFFIWFYQSTKLSWRENTKRLLIELNLQSCKQTFNLISGKLTFPCSRVKEILKLFKFVFYVEHDPPKINIFTAKVWVWSLKIARKSLKMFAEKKKKMKFSKYIQLTFNATYRTINLSEKALISFPAFASEYRIKISKKVQPTNFRDEKCRKTYCSLQTQHKFTQSPIKNVYLRAHQWTLKKPFQLLQQNKLQSK